MSNNLRVAVILQLLFELLNRLVQLLFLIRHPQEENCPGSFDPFRMERIAD